MADEMIHFFSKGQVKQETIEAAVQAWDKFICRQDLGFIHLPNRDTNWREAIQFAEQLKKQSQHLVVVGLGGSALGGKCLVDSLGDSTRVLFLYNTDPLSVDSIFLNDSYLSSSHFLFISKSGSTLELACLIDILQVQLKSRGRSLKEAVSVITEEKPSALHDWAKSNGLSILAHPKDVGGRFSAFTVVGLVPAIFSGVSASDLRSGGHKALKQRELVSQLAAFYYDSFNRGESISAFWIYVDQLTAFMPWLIQLWSESLAKKHDRQGQSAKLASTPVGYFGATDQHSVLQQLMEGAPDKSVCFVRNRQMASCGSSLSGAGLSGFEYLMGKTLGQVFLTQSQATEEALQSIGRSTLVLELDQVSAESLAEFMFVFELLIGVLGELLDINAFDQPGVELGKKITKEKLQKNSGL